MERKELHCKIALVLVAFIIYGAYQFLFDYRKVEASDNQNQQTIYYKDYYITGERDERHGFGDVEGTDNNFYVLNGQTVDVYDYQGNYHYSLGFTALARKGGTRIVCSSDTLYVSTKDNKIHAFRGTEYLGTISREELHQVYETLPSESRIFVARDGMYKRRENGEAEYLCPLPEVLAQSMPPIIISAQTNTILGYIFLALFFLAWGGFGLTFLIHWRKS